MSPFLLLAFQETTKLPVQDPVKPPVVAALDLRQAPIVAEMDRIRLTPLVDGKIADEEWDPLGQSGDTKTFLQWEPGVLHIAASGATGKDLLVSIDSDADGWLVGKNNLEVRIGMHDGKPTIKFRLLDATNVAGPTYREIEGLEIASKVAIGPDGTIEASIVDPGLDLLPTKSGTLAARVDVIPSDQPSLAANEPRMLSTLKLRGFRAAALPAGLKARVDFADIPVLPGEETTLRFGFKGEPMPKRIALRTEGLGREATSASELPFPAANAKKDVTVEYKTRIQPEAITGYRIARATLTGADGVPAIVQASYRIAPPIDIEIKDTQLKPSDKDRSVKVVFVVRPNSRHRLSGRTMIAVPGGYRVLNGENDQRILLPEPRLPLTRSFGLFVPANSKGTFPITFQMTFDDKKFDIVRYITVD